MTTTNTNTAAVLATSNDSSSNCGSTVKYKMSASIQAELREAEINLAKAKYEFNKARKARDVAAHQGNDSHAKARFERAQEALERAEEKLVPVTDRVKAELDYIAALCQRDKDAVLAQKEAGRKARTAAAIAEAQAKWEADRIAAEAYKAQQAAEYDDESEDSN